jgi:hypothetical protein
VHSPSWEGPACYFFFLAFITTWSLEPATGPCSEPGIFDQRPHSKYLKSILLLSSNLWLGLPFRFPDQILNYIVVFWDMTLSYSLLGSWRSEGKYCIHPSTLKMKAPSSSSIWYHHMRLGHWQWVSFICIFSKLSGILDIFCWKSLNPTRHIKNIQPHEKHQTLKLICVLLFLTNTSCPIYFISINCISLIISQVRNFFQLPLASPFLGLNILLIILSPNKIHPVSWFRTGDHISYPYKTTGQNYIFMYYDLSVFWCGTGWQKILKLMVAHTPRV